MTASTQEGANPQSLTISTKEAATLLGVHYVTMKRWVAAGTIPSIRIRHKRLIPKQVIRDLLASAYEEREQGGRR